MNNRMLKWTAAAVSAACLVPAVLWSDPLERTRVPRSNPAVNDMVRVPGVVGLHKFEALSWLQQGGLTPFIKVKREPAAQYKGWECKVISQVPVAGGVAMLGSSVSLIIYEPEGACEEAPGQIYYDGLTDDHGRWTSEEANAEAWSEEPGGDQQDQFMERLPQSTSGKMNWAPIRKPK